MQGVLRKLHLESHILQAPKSLLRKLHLPTRLHRARQHLWRFIAKSGTGFDTICSAPRPCLYGIYPWISHTGVILSTMDPNAHVVFLLGLPKRPHTNGNSKPPYKPRSLSFS